MRTGHTSAARLLVLTVAFLAGYFLATILGPHSHVQLLLLFASAMSFTFFPLGQWKFVLYGLALSLACYLTLELTDYRPLPGLPRNRLEESQLRLVRISSATVVWMIVVGQFAYHIRASRRSQERLVSTAKMVSLGQMAAGIAHEINNPLLIVVGHGEKLAELAARGPVAAEQAVRIADQIQKVAMRIGSIVHGLEALSRDASRDAFVELPLRPLIELTLDYCGARIRSHSVNLRMGEIPEDWKVIGREAQLSEVLLNVLNNALDAVLGLNERWIELQARSEPDWIELSVTDSGPGVEPGVRNRIFDPFFTTKPIGKGTGLGLSVSRGIIEAHAGQIFHDDASSRTRFVIRLPRVKPA